MPQTRKCFDCALPPPPTLQQACRAKGGVDAVSVEGPAQLTALGTLGATRESQVLGWVIGDEYQVEPPAPAIRRAHHYESSAW